MRKKTNNKSVKICFRISLLQEIALKEYCSINKIRNQSSFLRKVVFDKVFNK